VLDVGLRRFTGMSGAVARGKGRSLAIEPFAHDDAKGAKRRAARRFAFYRRRSSAFAFRSVHSTRLLMSEPFPPIMTANRPLLSASRSPRSGQLLDAAALFRRYSTGHLRRRGVAATQTGAAARSQTATHSGDVRESHRPRYRLVVGRHSL